MATAITIPKLGLTMVEARIMRWLKQEGKRVAQGEELVEIETEKATVVIEAPADGFLRAVTLAEGQTAAVGAVIGYITATMEEPVPAAATATVPNVPQREQTTTGVLAARAPEDASPATIMASPAARRRAAELGVDLAHISGSGPGGIISVADVERAAVSSQPAPEPTRPFSEQLLGRRRLAIAERMTRAFAIPQFPTMRDIDVSAVLTHRERLRAEGNSRLSLTDYLLYACVRALSTHSSLNAHFIEDGQPRLRLFTQIDIGLAVALPGGVVVPVLRDLGARSLAEIAAARMAAVERAQAGRLNEHDLADATFTLSNLGAFGVDRFVSLLDPPQVAILAVGRSRPVAVPRTDGVVETRQHLTATLTVDHRVLDGADAARFLADVARVLESWEAEMF